MFSPCHLNTNHVPIHTVEECHIIISSLPLPPGVLPVQVEEDDTLLRRTPTQPPPPVPPRGGDEDNEEGPPPSLPPPLAQEDVPLPVPPRLPLSAEYVLHYTALCYSTCVQWVVHVFTQPFYIYLHMCVVGIYNGFFCV